MTREKKNKLIKNYVQLYQLLTKDNKYIYLSDCMACERFYNTNWYEFSFNQVYWIMYKTAGTQLNKKLVRIALKPYKNKNNWYLINLL